MRRENLHGIIQTGSYTGCITKLNGTSDPMISIVKLMNTGDYNVNLEIARNPVFGRFYSEKEPSVIKWLMVHVIVNNKKIGYDIALKRILELNRVEFNDAGFVLADGNDFWTLVRIPEIRFTDEQWKHLRKLYYYYRDLSINWNEHENNSIDFEIDTEIFWPALTMPAAGTLNHNCNPSYKTAWIHKGTISPQ